ncbi:MAG: hypothetical protein Q9N62_11400 [Ghiorsea sp.]|nr:hypothetical protein [Ghiorsea sp.]
MKKIKIGKIRLLDIKVRKKLAPPTQVQKSAKDYDRKKLKLLLHKGLQDS